MTQEEQLAVFLSRTTIPGLYRPYAHWMQPQVVLDPRLRYDVTLRPTQMQVAEHLYALAEFRMLQLGTWLGTPDGQMLTRAIELASPPFLRTDVELLVEALKLAARMQQRDRRVAGAVAVGAGLVAVGLLAAAAQE